MAEKKKNQLHQLLAVETDLKNKERIIIEEAITTFSKKPDHFDGFRKEFKQDRADAAGVPPEGKEMVTTVGKKLDYVKKDIIKAIDAQVSKEETNSGGEAKAELEISGKTHVLSATSLLALVHHLEMIRAMYKSIPTLDPSKKWNQDKDAGKGIRISEPIHVYKTEKRAKPIVLHPPTKEHPAQTQMVHEDIQVGKYETIYKTGKLAPSDKADLINKVEDLIVKVKKARAKANQVEVKNTNIGKEIFAYINEGII
jgi:hypothetical protein